MKGYVSPIRLAGKCLVHFRYSVPAHRVFLDKVIAILPFVSTCASSSSNCFSSDWINLAERLPRILMSSRMVYARCDQGEWSCRSDESIAAVIRSGIVDVNAASISNGRNVSMVVHNQYTRSRLQEANDLPKRPWSSKFDKILRTCWADSTHIWSRAFTVPDWSQSISAGSDWPNLDWRNIYNSGLVVRIIH